MALTRERYTYVDFTTQKPVPLFAKTTNAIATAADAQEDYMWIDGQYFEHVQDGANAIIQYGPLATGWTVPLDASATDAIEITQGMLAGAATPMKFVVGTDAFYMKLTFDPGTLNRTVFIGAGFRELGAYNATNNLASEAITAYGECAGISKFDNSTVIKSYTSKAGSDAQVTATAVNVADTEITYEVYISATGVVTYKINGAADTLLDAGTVVTLTDAAVMVPYATFIRANIAGATDAKLVKYECGLQ